MTAPERRWPESEIETLTSLPKVKPDTPPAPVKRRIMEQDPTPKRAPTREEVEAIEDQILRMAFDKAMKTIRRKTLVIVFLIGYGLGFISLGVIMVVLILKAGV